jgi:hypothetical protein
MSIWRLVLREILYRKLNFSLAVVSVLAAVGCLVAELTILRVHDLQTEAIIARTEAETAVRVQERQARAADRLKQEQADIDLRMKKLEDDYRKISLNLGFNVLILPKDQNLSDLFADDFASRYMPEEYVERLAKSPIVTINHLLPSLQQKLKWPEQERTIILIGTRGEVPLLKGGDKKPLLELVPPGKMVLGYELHRSLGKPVQVGDRLTLLGREFTVHKLHEPRGSKDDITIWINLKEAQELLGKKGLINAILALECNCSADRLDKVRAEIAGILPDTQVIERGSEALTRAEARNRAALEASEQRRRAADRAQRERRLAALEAQAEVDAVKATRAELRRQNEENAALPIAVIVAGCIVWLGVLAFLNVRERMAEIGIFRALGLGSGQVFTLFLSKAILVGLLGAVLGYAVGAVAGWYWAKPGDIPLVLFQPVVLASVLAAAPFICALASSMPALFAVRQDPAVVLREN